MKESNQEDLKNIQHLYKYRYFDDNNYHIKTILDNEFYFASKDELNDPFDLSLRPKYEDGTIEQMRAYYHKYIDSKNGLSQKEKDIKKSEIDIRLENEPEKVGCDLIAIFEKEIKKYRVCSFSKDKWNDILMWAHYCNANTGFCVGIDWIKFSCYYWKTDNNLLTPYIVNYGEDYPLINPFIEDESNEALMKIFNYKFETWKYENELRIIMKSETDKTITIPECFIDEVYLGLRISKENKNMIVEALNLKKYKPKLYQIIQKNNSFEFDRKEIFYHTTFN